jgi:hypothetical protein
MNIKFPNCVESKLIEMMMMKMPMIQFVSVVILIPIQLMKVIGNLRNMMSKEFQYFMEFKSIAMTMMKVQMIPSESILSSIQMRFMSVSHNLKTFRTKNFEIAWNQDR